MIEMEEVVKLSSEREKDILRIIYDKRSVTVKELAALLYTSESSVRRDLEHLEKQHLLKRFHGGARLEANGISPIKVPYIMRELTYSDEKVLIAKKATSMVHDQNLIFLDSSSSAAAILPFLNGFRDITIVTNGLETLNRALDYNFKAMCVGGTLSRSARAFYGEDAYRMARNYFADICFISCAALDRLGEVCDVSIEENEMRRAFMAQSNHTYLLCTSEKLGLRKFHRCCNVSELDGVIAVKTPEKTAKRWSFINEALDKMIVAKI